MASTVYSIVRNNWKKAIFFNCASFYLSGLAYAKYKSFWMMREYCYEATVQGTKPLPSGAMNKHITLLLNPVASDRKSKSKYEKYVEPILHCAGFLVNVVQTERISEARDLTQLIEKTNIIAVAGGDGSLLETITGLLRRDDADEATRRYPIAVIPAGKENTFAHKLYSSQSQSAGAEPDEYKFIAQAGMAVVGHHIVPKHVIQFKTLRVREPEPAPEPLQDGTDTEVKLQPPPAPPKPVFGMNGLKIGWHRQAEEKRKSLPQFLGQKVTGIIALFRTPPAMLKAEIVYTPACGGCTKCQTEPSGSGSAAKSGKSLWSRFYSVFRPSSVYASTEAPPPQPASPPAPATPNPDCGLWTSMCVDTSEFNVTAMPDGCLRVDVGSSNDDLTAFLSEGLYRLLGRPPTYGKSFICNEIVIKPLEVDATVPVPEFCSIDNEEFELHEMSVKLLKNRVYFFTSA